MDPDRFEEEVYRVLDGLPQDFAERLENVQVVVKALPTHEELDARGIPEGSLLGLYEGIPLPRRGLGYSLVMPDKITIYRQPILDMCERTGEPVPQVIRMVVLHEIAHHFGIPDQRLRELGY